jgi:hypothetical protein
MNGICSDDTNSKMQSFLPASNRQSGQYHSASRVPGLEKCWQTSTKKKKIVKIMKINQKKNQERIPYVFRKRYNDNECV